MRIPRANLLVPLLVVMVGRRGFAQEQSPHASWAGGSTTLDMGAAGMTLTNKVWALFLAEFPDGKTALALSEPGATPRMPGQARGSFRIRKAESTLEGWMWNKALSYELELAYVSKEGILNHAMIDWDASKRGLFQVRFGMFKAPFGRQELTSSESLQFVNRSIVSDEFEFGEDVGLMFHGQFFGGKIDWGTGFFNGNGRNRDFNDNRNFQYDARLVFAPWGDVKYSESDFESAAHPLLALGLEFEHNDRRGAMPGTGARSVVLGADLVFKWRGLSLFTEAFYRDIKPETSSGRGAFRSPGIWAQGGVFVYKRTLEIAARYAAWDPDAGVANDVHDETGFAFNVFVHQHALKVQSDVRVLRDKSAATSLVEARVQTVFWF